MKTKIQKYIYILFIGIFLLSIPDLKASEPECDTLNWKNFNENIRELIIEKSWTKAILLLEDHTLCFDTSSDPENQINCLKYWSSAYLNLGNAERVFTVQQKMLNFIRNHAPKYYYQYLLGKMNNLIRDPRADMYSLYEEAQQASLDAGNPEGAMQARIHYLNWLRIQGEERRAFDFAKEALSFHEANNLKSCEIYRVFCLLTFELKLAGIPAARMDLANSLRRKAEACLQSGNEWKMLVEFYMGLSALYISLGMKSESVKLVEKAYELSRDFPTSRLTSEVAQAYMSFKFESVRDTELRELLKRLNRQSNLYNLENDYTESRLFSSIMNTTEYRNEAALQKSIVELREQALQQAKKNNRLFAFVLLILVLLLIAIISIFFLFSSRVKQKQAIAERERELNEYKAQYQGVQMERERVSKDLHDSVGSALVAALMQYQLDNRERADLLLNKAIGDVRSISHNLKPVYLEGLDFSEILKKLCDQWQSEIHSIHFYFIGNESEINVAIKESVYRICQELLLNAVKHAEAKNIVVQLQVENEKISLTVEDDGRGFSENNGTGIGLQNIKKRVEELNGELHIQSKCGEGTSVSIVISLNQIKIHKYGATTTG